MFKGIHIFCDGAIYCPVVTSDYGQKPAKAPVFTATDNKSRSDDDSGDNGQTVLIKSTLLNAKCFFFISGSATAILIG
ncbi:hypothetical protein D5F51_16335 [Yersinia hibernica]|uniref:Uncharacterized protein n=1 Tax=Yersinia hibernica TaxID=2339259 RepID=A0ABX5R2W8_9GAMM|nr:hypothetical protein D5F51_16335 [Yersinia hibernica]